MLISENRFRSILSGHASQQLTPSHLTPSLLPLPQPHHPLSPPLPPPNIVLPTIQYLWCTTLIFIHNFGFSVLVPEPQFVLCANVAETSRFRVHGSGFTVQGSRFRVHGSGFTVQGSRFRVHIQSLIYMQSEKEPTICTQTVMHD